MFVRKPKGLSLDFPKQSGGRPLFVSTNTFIKCLNRPRGDALSLFLSLSAAVPERIFGSLRKAGLDVRSVPWEMEVGNCRFNNALEETFKVAKVDCRAILVLQVKE